MSNTDTFNWTQDRLQTLAGTYKEVADAKGTRTDLQSRLVDEEFFAGVEATKRRNVLQVGIRKLEKVMQGKDRELPKLASTRTSSIDADAIVALFD